MNKIIFLLAALIFIFGCSDNLDKNNNTSTNAECTVDSDCGTGGCSGQICGQAENVKGISTTCEWKQEYDCLKQTTCSCIEGRCQWQQTAQYINCLQSIEPYDDVVLV